MRHLFEISKLTRWQRLIAMTVLCLVIVANLCSCANFLGKHSVYLHTKRDIKRAKSDTQDIGITYLPLQDYHLLSKFTQLERVNFYNPEGTLVTDDKLKALASLNFTNLTDISLLNCRLVTDEGISALSKIKSLRGLQLEGTAITDVSMDVMVSMTNFVGVNVANCPGVTLRGLKILATSTRFDDIGFSADNLSQEDVLGLLASFKKNVRYCGLLDREWKLDHQALQKVASERGFQLVIQRIGALQNMESMK